MDFDNDFFIQAQGVIERTFRAKRQELIDLYGRVESDIKDDGSVVTALDKQMEQELRDALADFDKTIGFEGEEFGISGNRDTFWLIDPIDGTESFVRGIPVFRNMVTLIDKNEPIFTIVYKPVTDELFVAGKGEGAFRNGQKLNIGNRPLERAWLELSVSLRNPDNVPLVQAVAQKIYGFRTIGDFPLIPQGKMDGMLVYKSTAGPWDYAPRALLIQEAGGRVANIGSDTYDFRNNDILGTNPIIFDELMKIITEAA